MSDIRLPINIDKNRTCLVARFPIHPKAPHRITKEEKPEFKETGTKFGPSLDWIKPRGPLSTDWPISLSFSRFKHWKKGWRRFPNLMSYIGQCQGS
jgi:hypothetical protein